MATPRNTAAVLTQARDEQLWVPIGLPDDQELPIEHVRSSRRWDQAIATLLTNPRLQAATQFERLPQPNGCESWYVTRRGIAFRCCYCYVPFSLDGGRPGYRGRVDVRFHA